MEVLNVKLVGVSSLFMHSPRLNNPLDPEVKKHKLLTAKRAKTDDDHREIARSEFELGMYFDKAIGPYMPGQNILMCTVAGGKQSKLGSTILRSTQVLADKIPLQYEGPRTVQGLWDKNFYDIRQVAVQASRTMRCRACFEKWSLNVEFTYDESMIDRHKLLAAIIAGGKYAAIGDYRPMFGRFSVEVL